jgi:vancomycin resistance protein YoaR
MVEPQDALFQFNEDWGKVTEFESSRDGRELVMEEMVSLLTLELDQLEVSEATMAAVKLPVRKIEPEVGLEDVNKLGINQLIGRGKSTFRGSIATRVHNIGLAASRLNGVLVKPGATFSFNANLGEVSAATGYRQAYVIRSGRTELDDGGGVCQVSTTFFRAILDAGLPVKERRAHSYRVGYYEQDAKPGLDATVFAPRVDLKFRNDTPAYILIQSEFDRARRTLKFDLYGTSDGRIVESSTPRVWDVSEPPEDVYQDDPSLPTGEVKQIEYKAWGAKAAFDWKVMRGDEVLQERTFYSSYKPWGAVYLRGVGPQ